MVRCDEISVCQSTILGGFWLDIGRETGRKECGQARKGNFAMIEGVCVWFLVYSSFIFLNVHKICNRLISKPGHLYIFSPGKASRSYVALRSVFYGFWAQGSHILLKVQKICNWLIYNMVIFEKPCFSPYGLPPPPGAILSRGGFLLILSIWLLYFCEIT